MKIATIHRNEHDNRWIVRMRDTIRETQETKPAETLGEAETIANEYAGEHGKVKTFLGER